jgi:hypothetical protein
MLNMDEPHKTANSVRHHSCEMSRIDKSTEKKQKKGITWGSKGVEE